LQGETGKPKRPWCNKGEIQEENIKTFSFVDVVVKDLKNTMLNRYPVGGGLWERPLQLQTRRVA
jgi:hypothetical protein